MEDLRMIPSEGIDWTMAVQQTWLCNSQHFSNTVVACAAKDRIFDPSEVKTPRFNYHQIVRGLVR